MKSSCAKVGLRSWKAFSSNSSSAFSSHVLNRAQEDQIFACAVMDLHVAILIVPVDSLTLWTLLQNSKSQPHVQLRLQGSFVRMHILFLRAPHGFATGAMRGLISLTVSDTCEKGTWEYFYALENSDFFMDEKCDSCSIDLLHTCQLLTDT